MHNKLILCSTFRHYFLGIALALSDKECAYHAVFIDQKGTQKTNLLLKLATNTQTPFSSITILPPRPDTSFVKKLRYRKHCFSLLEKLLKSLSPVEIISGNDRRVEFQFCMQLCIKLFNYKVIGSHIDDGTGTYIPQASYSKCKAWIDRKLETAIKRITYGKWYDYSGQLGTSKWISTLYLTFPELIAPRSNITINPIPAEAILSSEGRSTLMDIFCQTTHSINNRENSVVFALPHSSLYNKLYNSPANLVDVINRVSKKYDNVYIKYHPRDTNDPLQLKNNYNLLTSEFPIEYFLVTLNITHLISDISTSLLSAKWVNPKMKAEYLPTESEFSGPIQELFKKVQINPIK